MSSQTSQKNLLNTLAPLGLLLIQFLWRSASFFEKNLLIFSIQSIVIENDYGRSDYEVGNYLLHT